MQGDTLFQLQGVTDAFQNNSAIIPPSKTLILEPSIAECETQEPIGNAVTFCTNFISITSGYISREMVVPANDALPETSPSETLNTRLSIIQAQFSLFLMDEP